jgi:peptidoglycan/xylan/chitin deacetylase (PgdA/CDA1 family)
VSAVARRFAKHVLARGLLRSGGWDALLRTWARRNATVILTYHRVLEQWEPTLDYSQPGMVVTRATFERQLAFLERYFEVVSLDALIDDRSADRSGRQPRCVITFDDGWRDNYDVAFPILRRRGLPATIFLTTDLIGSGRAFWHTELISLLMHHELSTFLRSDSTLRAYPRRIRDGLRECAGAGRISGAADVDTLIETIKSTCDEDVIQRLIDILIRAAGVRRPLVPERRFFLEWDHVREMAANGIEIGSHGCSHRIMTRLSFAEARRELVQSKADIESRIGRDVAHFAFPNEDTTETLVGLAARAGYRTACVGAAGEHAGGPKLRVLRRVGIHEGASLAGAGYDDALLGLCLLRAPKSRPA